MRQRPLLLLLSTGAAAATLSWFVAQHSLVGARWRFFIPLAGWVVAWMLGAWAAVRVRNARIAIGSILLLAAALRLAAVTGTTPSISNDLYRYGWDARVQVSGTDPYRYPPVAPQLRSLRVPPYFPDPAGCAHIGQPTGCTTINRPGDRTIYPPVAQAWFDVVYLLSPGREARDWQLAGAAVDMVAIGLIMIGLKRMGRDPRSAAWYALSPIAVVEFAGNGHVDGLGLVFLLAALLALERGRPKWAGFFIGMATMVKLYPGIAAIACWRKGRWAMATTAAVVCFVAYSPHAIAVGTRVVGYLPGYLKEEHYGNGARFLLIGILPLPAPVITTLAVAVVLAAALWVMSTAPPPAQGTAVLVTVALLVTSPVQPWYAVPLAAIATLTNTKWLVLPAALGELYYAAVILNTPHAVAIGRLCYGTVLIVAAAAAVVTDRSRSADGDGLVASRDDVLVDQ